MAISLLLFVEVSCRAPKMMGVSLIARRMFHAFRKRAPKATALGSQPDDPLFWCPGVAQNNDLWPDPPPYPASSYPLLPEVHSLPSSGLEDQVVWIHAP